MGMPSPQTEWTAEMAVALPDDGNRYEVLDGELFVTPAPTYDHQAAIGELVRLLDPFVRENALGHLTSSPADIRFSPKRLVQPDLFVVPLVDGRRPRTWNDVHSLVLVIEVLSPSTAFADRNRKRRIYMDAPVDEYWIVDLDARVVERWVKGIDRAEVLADLLAWQPTQAPSPLHIDLNAYFDDVLGPR